MSVELEQRGALTVLKVDGDLAGANAERLRDLARPALLEGRREFVVDLAGANSCDSAGLEALTWLQRQCQEQLGLVHLAALSRTFGKIMELTRLQELFQYSPPQPGAGGGAGDGHG